jgi:hypothetical protein
LSSRPTAVLLVAVLLALLFRAHGISLKQTITHDEGITYLAATGHQEEFSKLYDSHEPPYGRWVPASEWQRYWKRDVFWCFRKIGHDLAYYDIHPPLYFWLLHAWLWIVGVHVWSGVALNLLITLAMMVVLYRFARYILSDGPQAAAVVFLWAVNPYVMQESMEGRAYGLFALFCLLLCWSVVRVVHGVTRPRFAALAAIALSTLGGALTHYHFALAAAGVALYALLRMRRANLIRVYGAMAAGYVLFVCLHPHFLRALSLGHEQAQPFSISILPQRIYRTASAFSGYLVPIQLGPVGVLLGAFAVLAAVGYLFVRRGDIASRRQHLGVVLYFLAWFSACIVLLYVASVSPVHAMGPKYLSPVWPFLSFVPVFVARSLSPRNRRRLIVGLCVYQVAYAGAVAGYDRLVSHRHPSQGDILARAEVLVLDNVARGVLPRVLFGLPGSVPVYAAMQDYLLEHPKDWRDRLDEGTMFVSKDAYGNSAEGRERIVRMIEARHALERARGGLWGFAYYSVGPGP